MLIKSFAADNFKSLVDFHAELPKFACLIGLNGAGKSTIIQFVDFLAQQMRGDLKGWLAERQWRAAELHSQFSGRRNIVFRVSIHDDLDNPCAFWFGSFNTSTLRCSHEFISTSELDVTVKDGRLRIDRKLANAHQEPLTLSDIAFEYEGSIASRLRLQSLPESLSNLRDYFSGVNSLELLAPQFMRQRTREADGTLGLGGQRLSAYLYESGPDRRQLLTEKLRQVYENLEAVDASALQYGWKQLRISERFDGKLLKTDARHVSDGMLRLIAILAELHSDHPLLLFDEIENGINPELVEFVIEALVTARQQVIVTTHSPLILNYLDDETARSSVLYVYRRPDGITRCIPFFSIPSMAEKLQVMGPGEAFADTNLHQLQEEIRRMPETP